MPTIRPGAPLIAVGEAPGANEVTRGVGFVGVSGEILDAALAAGGVARGEISVSNAILCRPPEEGNFAEYVEGLRSGYLRALKRWHKVWLTPEEMTTLTPPKRDALAHKRWAADCSDRDPDGGGAPLPSGPPALPMLPQDACRGRLIRDLEESNSTVVLAVGKQALESVRTLIGLESTKTKLTDGAGAVGRVAPIKKQHGAPVLFEDELGQRRVLMTTYHPAMALRDKPQYLDVIKSNVRRAAEIARAGGRIRWTEPDFLLSPDEDLIHRTLDRYTDAFARGLCTVGLTVDIETDSIDPHTCLLRCVGLGADIVGQGEVLLCIPFRRMDGAQWWADPAAKIRVALHLRDVLDSVPLVFQNGIYDTTVLLRLGLMTTRGRRWVDTLLLHKNTPDNDLPHDLGFIVRRHYDAPLWKEDVDHKGTADAAMTVLAAAEPEVALAGADRQLHVYNLKDVLGTLRVVPPLWAEVVTSETTAQLETDTAMLPVIRDMSELGLVVNEWQRGAFSQVLNKSCHELRARFQEQVGRRINPRSSQQLRELFYIDWGYVPVVATDGYEFEPEADDVEDGSTSNQALTRLQVDRIIDPSHPHWAAVETLLAFRANDKLRGTYVDKLPTTAVDWAAHGMAVGGADAVRGWVYDPVRDVDVEVEILAPRSGLSITRTTYKNHVVPTGRLASGDPINIQNVPIAARGGLNLRHMFVAPPGHVIVGADYDQVEARLYAIIAQDYLLLKAIREKLDIHSLNAAALFMEPGDDLMARYEWVKTRPEAEKKHIRTVAKRFCFALLYGADWPKIYQVMVAERSKATGERTFPNVTEDDCKRWAENWHKLHPETSAWHARVHAGCAAYGFSGSPMLDYRKRFFRDGAAQENAIPNMTIQSSAAALANRALLAIAERIPYRGWSYWSGPVYQIHDYIGVVVPESRWEEAKRIVEECMFYSWNGMDFTATANPSWTLGQQ